MSQYREIAFEKWFLGIWWLLSRLGLLAMAVAMNMGLAARGGALGYGSGYVLLLASWFSLGMIAPFAFHELIEEEMYRKWAIFAKLAGAVFAAAFVVAVTCPWYALTTHTCQEAGDFWQSWPSAWPALLCGLAAGSALLVWHRRRRARRRQRRQHTSSAPLSTHTAHLL